MKNIYEIGQILTKCRSNLRQMEYYAERGRINIVQNLKAETTALLEKLENVYNYKATNEIRDKMVIYESIATEHDYYSNFEFL